MSSTRDVIAPPVFASEANTVIPPNPIAGVSYRDPSGAPARSPAGWPYSQIVNSADFNQIMFQLSSLVSIIDRKGLLGWSTDVDYTEPAILFGSDGQLYLWLQASGPSQGGARDPLSSPTYWSSLSNQFGGFAGDVRLCAANTPPPDALACDGAAYSRTIYSRLFNRIGTIFGAGNGTTTFNVPDMRGEFIRGWDAGRGVDPGRAFGSLQQGSLIVYDLNAGVGVQSARAGSPAQDNPSSFGADSVTSSVYPGIVEAGSSASGAPLGTNTVIGQTRPRSVSLLFCIKY